MHINRIFGTPPEPVFNMRVACLSAELLEEALYVLAEENEKNMDNAWDRQGFFKGGKPSEYTFSLCKEMELPPETRFLAIELFDRFMAKHVCSLYDLIRSTKGVSQKDWTEVENRIKTQLPLRVVSCVQIASKLISHYKSITPNKARRFLNSISCRYSNASILKSELRILKTLDYSMLVPTPLTFVETILEILGHNDSRAQVKLLHDTSIKVLDVVYLKHHEIYNKLCMTATGEKGTSGDRQKLAVLASDHMLLAVSAISTASYLTDKSSSDMVIEQLSQITQISKEDILDFANIILEFIL
ncbi:cyclin N-terminal domain-containing protein 1 [Nematostella vectensis]|uniref:cyclin N-terminal domain-containing protein 1 n=1 Tax=Nematostella vectensis TaxID=45351 RepID=UPI00138FEC71|nr:cyclin N-terminal domain-containing protein 1 [Nematostella vectensis]